MSKTSILKFDPKNAKNNESKRSSYLCLPIKLPVFAKSKKTATKAAESRKTRNVFAEEVIQSVDQRDGSKQNENSLNLETKSETQSLVLSSECESKEWNKTADNVIREALERTGDKKKLSEEIVSEMKRRCGYPFGKPVWNCLVHPIPIVKNFSVILSDFNYAVFDTQGLQIIVFKRNEESKRCDLELQSFTI